MATDPVPEVRHTVVPVAAKMNSLESMRRLLSADDPQVRRDVIDQLTLPNFGINAIPLLASALEDTSGEVSSDAAAKLGDIGIPAVAALAQLEQAALHSPDTQTRIESLRALKRIGPQGWSTIDRALQDPDESVRNYAAQMLRRD